jgi:outer membrane protein OmpA-like peptidoglycan-associated protein
MTGPMERLAAAVNSHDVHAVTGCFTPDATVELLSTGYRWTGQAEIAAVVDHLMTTFQGLTWRPRNRWLDAGGATEEGVWAATCVGRSAATGLLPASVPLELPARVLVDLDGGRISRLRLSTDLTGLRIALGLPVSAAAAALDTSQYRTRTSGSPLKVHVRPDAGAAAPPVTPKVPATRSAPARGGRRSPRRRAVVPRWLTITLAAVITAAVGGGVVFLGARGAPHQAKPRTPLAGAPQRPSPSATTPAPSQSADPTPTAGVTKRGNHLDLSTDVLFDQNSSVLTARAVAALDQVVKVLRENHVHGRIQVIGYTDNTGSPSYNVRLSKRRAMAVVTALRNRPETVGLTFVPSGKGEDNPVGDNAFASGQALNRRVTIVLPKL